jgi:hypothetical protein
MRTCWPGLSASFNPFVPSPTLAQRRLAFVLANTLQLVYFALYVSGLSLLHPNIPWTIAKVLFFFWGAWNMHLIVQMEGSRVVFGKSFGRGWFDGALWGAVVCYAGLLGWRWAGVEVRTGWLVVDLCVLGVAWVSTWEELIVVSWNDAV